MNSKAFLLLTLLVILVPLAQIEAARAGVQPTIDDAISRRSEAGEKLRKMLPCDNKNGCFACCECDDMDPTKCRECCDPPYVPVPPIEISAAAVCKPDPKN